MSDGLRSLHALAVALADVAVGGLLVRYVSVPMGAALAIVGSLVLLTAAYRAVCRTDRADSRAYGTV